MDARYRLASMREARAREARVKQGDLAGAVHDEHALAAAVTEASTRVAAARAALDAAVQRRAQALGPASVSAPVATGDQVPTAVRSPGLAPPRGPTPVPTVTALVQLEHYVHRLRRDLEAAHGERARAEAAHAGQRDAVDAARTRFRHARAERELIERHFATWRAARQKLAERRED